MPSAHPASLLPLPLRGRDLDVTLFAEANGMGAPQLLRATTGASAYRCGNYVIRIAQLGRSAITSERLLAASKLLRAFGVAAVAGHGRVRHTGSGEEITVWDYVPCDPTEPYPGVDIGRAARKLHAIPLAAAAAGLGREVPALVEVAARTLIRVQALELEAARGTATGAAPGQLTAAFKRLSAALAAACAASEPVLLHGDLNAGNVLWGVLPHAVLCDFEALTQGSWAWDLVHAQVAVARGRQPQRDLDALVSGYGKDPADCPGWAAMCHMLTFDGATWCVTEALAGSMDMAEAQTLMSWFIAGLPGLPPLEPGLDVLPSP